MLYKYARLPRDIAFLEYSGNFSAAVSRIKWLLGKDIDNDLRLRLEYELERISRIKKDYPYDEVSAKILLKDRLGDWALEKFDEFFEKGWLDYIVIDGKRYFFRAFIDNLLFLCDEPACEEAYKQRAKEGEQIRKSLVDHINSIINSGEEGFIMPRKVRVRMTLGLPRGTLEPNQKVRCWLPYPIESQQQPEVKLLGTSHKNYYLAPKDSKQRTIYFELNAEKDGSVTCWVEYEYTIKAFYRKVDPKNVRITYENKEVFDEYTKEQPPHIVFTRRIRQLAQEIVGDEENPYLKARRIYDWITKNMTYTYVPEYSTFESIAEYVSSNLRGDCGFHAILFITLARIVGIPAKWQSGWYANPAMKGPSPHDWAQFYVEPYGWLFADLSFGRYWRNRNSVIHEFYFGNIDSYRTVFNEDIMSQFDPPKKYLRSDPIDNQRGEIETEDGNIYYDKIQYKMEYI